MNTPPEFIRRTLVGRFLFELESQLKNEKLAKIYDEKFLERVGEKREKLYRLATIFSYIVVAIDILLVTYSNNISVKIKISGNEITNTHGAIELLLILSSFSLFSAIMYLYSSMTYDSIINKILKEKIPIDEPIFIKSSYSHEYFMLSIFRLYFIGYKSNPINSILVFAVYLIVIAMLAGWITFHIWAFVLGAEAASVNHALGPFLTPLVIWVSGFMNAVTFTLVSLTCFVRFKFRWSVPNNSADPNSVQ